MTAIAQVYVKLIQKGVKTIDDVPAAIREQVEEILNPTVEEPETDN